MRNADYVESRAAIIEPTLRHRIEFLWFQPQHLRADHKLRTGFLLPYQIVN
jgi:hypothetical protein